MQVQQHLAEIDGHLEKRFAALIAQHEKYSKATTDLLTSYLASLESNKSIQSFVLDPVLQEDYLKAGLNYLRCLSFKANFIKK